MDICSRIATLWSVTLGIEIKPEQVPLCLMQLKIARRCNKPEHDDSIIDIAGYASVMCGLPKSCGILHLFCTVREKAVFSCS